MKPRILWFVAGSAAGVYATTKARRAAHRLSMPGLVDQAAALGLGWRAFSSELRDGMETRERAVVGEELPPVGGEAFLIAGVPRVDVVLAKLNELFVRRRRHGCGPSGSA